LSKTVFDYETKNRYTIFVETKDLSGAAFSQIYTINIIDQNDPPTSITLSPAQVDENQPVETLIGYLTVEDTDASDTHNFTLVTGNGINDKDNRFFSISGNAVYAQSVFNFELIKQCNLFVEATDIAGSKISKSIIITVNDLNEFPSNLQLTVNNISEDKPSGSLVGNFTVADEDANEIFTYSFVNDDVFGKDNHNFIIENNALKTNTVLDGKQAEYKIYVEVKDKANNALKKAFSINVLKVNKPPFGIEITATKIDENIAAGSTVATIKALDSDAVDSHSFALVSGDGTNGTDNEKFKITGNALIIIEKPNFETKSNYSVNIEVKDLAGESFQQSFIIQVNDLNEPPTSLSINATSINENLLAGALIGVLSSSDEDGEETKTYQLSTYNDEGMDNPLFFIENDQLKAKQPFDYETKSSYSIYIKISDKAGNSRGKNFTITVLDQNDAPTAITLSNTVIDEGDPIGTIVGTFAATDQDISDSHTFVLTETSVAFRISGNQLVCKESPDFENNSEIVIKVKATDKQGAWVEKNIAINITDQNDLPVIANPIPDQFLGVGLAFNYVIPANAFSDQDKDERLVYSASLSDGTALPSWLGFNGNTGTFNGTPTAQVSINIKVTATDLMMASISDTFTLTIQNNNAPVVANPFSDTILVINKPFIVEIPVNTFMDGDTGDKLILKATLNNGDPLPTWLTFDNTSLTFSGIPTVYGTCIIKLTATDLSGASVSDLFIMEVKNAAGIDEIVASDLAIYPNPSDGYLTITFNKPVYNSSTITITDLTGKTVLVKTLFSPTTKLNLHHLDSGIYLLYIQHDDNLSRLKFILR